MGANMDDPLIGTKINRYEIQDCLHKTDLLGLYKVFDTKLERNALMKLVFHSPDYSKEFIEYFLGEARSLAKMCHPNVARILDFGYDGGNLYLISEYHARQTLADFMTGPIPWQQAIEMLIPVTEALCYAHSQGIIHRDLKPENIALAEDGRPVLSDFSLIRMIESEETRDMTGTNVGLGSPAYISPEQGTGMSVDFRSDIYSLGVIFFEMITGRKPFSAGTSMEIVIQHVTTRAPSPRSIIPALPAFVEQIILTSLSKDPAQRYQSMQELSDILRSALVPGDQSPKKTAIRINPRVAAGMAALVLAAVTLSVVSIRRNQQQIPASTSPDAASATALPTKTAVPGSAESTATPAVEIIAPSLTLEEPEMNVFPEAAFSL
ncbi:MAG: serine/threonine protein kinase, partial [Chloroflexi bacterium]